MERIVSSVNCFVVVGRYLRVYSCPCSYVPQSSEGQTRSSIQGNCGCGGLWLASGGGGGKAGRGQNPHLACTALLPEGTSRNKVEQARTNNFGQFIAIC